MMVSWGQLLLRYSCGQLLMTGASVKEAKTSWCSKQAIGKMQGVLVEGKHGIEHMGSSREHDIGRVHDMRRCLELHCALLLVNA